jgi:hypothetical protein
MTSKKSKEANARTLNFIIGMLVGMLIITLIFGYAFYLGELCTPNGNIPCKPQITNRTSFAMLLEKFCYEKLGVGAEGDYSPHMTAIGTVSCYVNKEGWTKYEHYSDFCDYALKYGVLC